MARKREKKPVPEKEAKPEPQKALSDAHSQRRRVLMNVLDSEQLRVAIAGANGLEELYIERSSNGFAHGNIYKGKIQNIEPTLQAAFVDIGGEKNGFLHANTAKS